MNLEDTAFELEEMESEEDGVIAKNLEEENFFSPLWLDIYNELRSPLVLLDSNLTIQCRNRAFQKFRETAGLEYRGRPFHALFSTFAEKSAREALITAVHDPKCGFGWNGRVEGRGPSSRHFIAQISIFPIEYNTYHLPQRYLAIVEDLTEFYRTIIRANFDSILQASLLKDEDTGSHVKRVNSYSKLLTQEMKNRGTFLDIDDDFIDDIGLLAAFHDVGKIGIPETILLKDGKLTEEEWQVMKEHPINGALILDAHPNPMGKEIARSHHEHWDGLGYPYGLAGEDIPISGRIVALADVYDALRSKRTYKEAFSEEKAFSIIMDGAGTHFDPQIVEIFGEIRDKFNEIFESIQDH